MNAIEKTRRPALYGIVALAVGALVLGAGCECMRCTTQDGQTVCPPPGRAQAAARPAPEGCPPVAEGMTSSGMSLPTGNRDTSVVFVRKSAPKELTVGREFEYVICLTNLTEVELTNVTLTETLPEGLEFKSATPQARQDEGTLAWEVGKLAPAASKTFTIRAAAANAGTMTGCTDVDYEIPGVCLALRAVKPELELVRSAPAEAVLCDVIKHTLVVRNTGSGTASNVVITDSLPEGLTTLDGREEAVIQVGSLAPGESREYTVQTKAEKTGKYTGMASASAEGGLTAKARESTTTVRTPVLAIKKTGPEVRFVGRPVTYTIAVSNMGDARATDVILTDSVETGGRAEFVSASDGGAMQQGKITWRLGDIPTNQSKTVEFTLRPTQLGELRSTATASAYCARDVEGVATEIKGIPAILLEAIDLDDPIEVGANETYVITVTNQGSAIGTGIVIECVLPEGQEFVSADGPTPSKADGDTVTFAPLAKLDPKAKATYRVVTKSIEPGDVRFRVRLTSDQLTSPVEESESTNMYR